jgi:hypothetical protein
VVSKKTLVTFKNKYLSDVPRTNVSKGKLVTRFYLHFYSQIGQGDWYVSSYKIKKNDIIFYGLIVFTKKRYDYFSLASLKRKKLPFGFKIMIDPEFKSLTKSKLLKSL